MTNAIFELTMPSVASWNGKWSGADQKYTVKKSLMKSEEHLIGQSFTYRWDDGWMARVEVRKPLLRERATNKFAGYNWMIESIRVNGEIIC